MAKLQDYFEWVEGLSDEDAVFAILGMGMVLGQRGQAGWSGTKPPKILLDECRSLARHGKLKIHLSRTWRLIDRLHPFLGEAKRLADFARQVIDGKPTWLVIPDLTSICSKSKWICLTGTRGLPYPVVNRQILYEAMLAPMRPRENPRDLDLALVTFWSDTASASTKSRLEPWMSDFSFRWPLRLSASEGSVSQINQELASLKKDWMTPLISLQPEHDDRTDLLLIDHQVAIDYSDMDVFNATIIVVLSSSGEQLSSTLQEVIKNLLNGRIGSLPAAVVYIQSNEVTLSTGYSLLTRWTIEFARNLSHDRSLLASVFAACASKEAASMPFVFSRLNPVKYDRRLSEMIPKQLQDSRFESDRWMDLDGPVAERLMVTPGLRPLGRLADDMMNLSCFHQESRDATTIAEVFRNLDRNKTFSAAEIDVNRWLQAQVLNNSQEICRAFLINLRYAIRVWIGPEDPGSIRADVRFPSHKLDWSDDVEQLTVVFTEPTYARDPQIRTVDLPRLGHSTTCDFTLETILPVGRQAPPAVIRARVAILHRNRVLQTAILSGELIETTVPSGDRLIRLEIEGVVRPDLNDLRRRTHFGAAMIVNETAEHEHTVTTISTSPDVPPQATFRPLTGILETMKLLSKQLTKIASLEQPPAWDSEEFEQMLRFLATHGYEIYRVLVKEQSNGLAERVESATHLQVVAADEQVYFPIELFYSRLPPLSTAKVCPAAKDALRGNACPIDCPGRNNTDAYVCPMGFLGMQKVIERHICRSDSISELVPGSFLMQLEPSSTNGSLPVFQRIVYGASKRVWEFQPPLMPTLESTMTSLCPGRTVSVASWDELKTKSTGVSLLVLIPHCEIDQLLKYESLEIGTIEEDWSMVLSDLRRGHLGLASEEKRPVVVFLMGCETGSPDADYKGFAAKFREQGAAVVVTSLSKVLGRQVVPVTQALLTGISEALSEGIPVRLGELLTEQRRKLLADGYALVIGITAYGDADWQLVATPTQVEEVAHVVS